MYPHGHHYPYSIFKYPPYQRHIPWRCDADYEMAIVSPVGLGPKGEDGKSLTYDDLTREQFEELATIFSTGAPGESAYEIAKRRYPDAPETVDEPTWLASLKGDKGDQGPKGDFDGLDETQKAELAQLITDQRISETIRTKVNEIASDILGEVYPLGSLYFTMENVHPHDDLGFPGTWTQLEDRFLYASTGQAGQTGGAANGKIYLTEGQLPAHKHSGGNLVYSHTHKENGDLLARPTYNLHPSGGTGKTRQRKVKSGNSLIDITSFTRQSNISTEGTHYDGRAIIFNSLRLTADSTSGAQNLVSTYGVNSGATWSGSTGSTGNGDPVDIMPPYITVHVWQRTGQDDPVSDVSDDFVGDDEEGYTLQSDPEDTNEGEE